MDKIIKQKAANKLCRYICPAALGSVICFAVIYTLYKPYALLYSVIFLAAEFLLFSLFDRLQAKKTVGGLLYMLLLIAVGFVSMWLMVSEARVSDVFVLSWFYGDEGSETLIPGYLNSVYFFGGFFVISILYYFTQVRYRSLGVMLSILFPFVIYAKRAEEVPEVLVTLIITLYLSVMVHNRRIDPAEPKEKQGRLIVNRAYIISVAIFVSVAGAVAMMIDKPVYRSQLEKNSSYFDYVNTNATGAGDYEGMSNTSSKRYGGNSYSNTPIFYFETDGEDEVYFLRREAYDVFNGSVWEVSDGFADYSRIYSSDNPEYSTDDIIADLNGLAVSGALSDKITPPVQSMLKMSNGRVYDESFSPFYLPAPYATVVDDRPYNEQLSEADGLIKYPHGEIYRSKQVRSVQPIDVEFQFLEQTDAFKSYAASIDMTGAEYWSMLIDAIFSAEEDNEYARRLLEDYSAAYVYADGDDVSQEIKDLAAKITRDCTGDFEKAYALEQYFEENGFVYDMEYVPEDESIEYFLFEGKTGVCSSYATAMTLMARAVDLPARYVEGFAAYERTDSGSFVVRDSHAHAFVEVYIAGAGWMTFDPTVSDYMQPPEEENNFNAAAFIRVFGKLLVVIAVVFVVIFILLLDRIAELVFRIRLKFKAPRERTLALYANLIKLVNFSTQEDYSPYTVKMMREYLEESRGTAPYKLLMLFEKTCFGGYQPSAEEFSEVYSEYKKCYRYLRKIPKKLIENEA
ncbi:MAG: transglutaminase family protein [Oscillospiraceae bacterium]